MILPILDVSIGATASNSMTAANQFFYTTSLSNVGALRALLFSFLALLLVVCSTPVYAYNAISYEGELDLGDDITFLSQWEISPDGRFLFAYLISGMRVVSFHRDPETGHLVQVGSLAVDVNETRGIEMQISDDGHFLYLTGNRLDTIQQIAIDQASGALSMMNPEALRLGSAANIYNLLIQGKNLYVGAGVNTPEAGFGRVYHVRIEPGSGALSLRDEITFPRSINALFGTPDGRHLYATEIQPHPLTPMNLLHVIDLQSQGFMGDSRLALETPFHPLVSNEPAMDAEGKFFYAIGLMDTDPPFSFLLTFERDPDTGLMRYREKRLGLTRFRGEDQIIPLLDGQMLLSAQRDRVVTFSIHPQNGSVQELQNDSPEPIYGYRVFITDPENKFLYAARREGVSLFRINGLPTAVPQQVPALSHWAVVALLFMVGFFGLLCQRFRRRDDEIVL